MSNATEYGITVQWSEDQGSYVAISPEFSTILAYGPTRVDAFLAGVDALEERVKYYIETGRALPEPLVHHASASAGF